MVRQDIEQAIKSALAALGAADVAFVVERPANLEHGDYSTNVALVAFRSFASAVDSHVGQINWKGKWSNPLALAEELVANLQNKIPGVKKIKVAGAGFINFFLSYEALMPKKCPIPKVYSKVVLVEYTSPNLFKPLHIGNLVGNIIGESISRLLQATGATIKRINYPSDIGLTVAKGVWGLLRTGGSPESISDLGKAYQAGNAAYEDGSAKGEINLINVALYENSNPQWSALRRKGIETSRRHLDGLCERLGTKFDKEFFESESGPLGRDIVLAHIDDGVFEKSDGAVIFRAEKYDPRLHTRVFINSEGFPTYEAKEVGLFELKNKTYPEFDTSYTITGSEQKDFFKVSAWAIGEIYRKKGKDMSKPFLQHIPHGFLRLTNGKMSSRLGNVITGESLLEDTTKIARGREDVAVAALKYTVLKSAVGKDIVFDPEQSLSLEGDSGPYLQYALVRTRALLRKAAGVRKVESMKVAHDADFTEVGSMYRLKQILIHFPEVVERAAKSMEPHHVVTYMMELASTFSRWYGTERIIVDDEILADRIDLIEAVEYTLEQGLYLLGIPAPEEM